MNFPVAIKLSFIVLFVALVGMDTILHVVRGITRIKTNKSCNFIIKSGMCNYSIVNAIHIYQSVIRSLSYPINIKSISGVMANVLTLSVVDHEFESLSGQTKDY